MDLFYQLLESNLSVHDLIQNVEKFLCCEAYLETSLTDVDCLILSIRLAAPSPVHVITLAAFATELINWSGIFVFNFSATSS